MGFSAYGTKHPLQLNLLNLLLAFWPCLLLAGSVKWVSAKNAENGEPLHLRVRQCVLHVFLCVDILHIVIWLALSDEQMSNSLVNHCWHQGLLSQMLCSVSNPPFYACLLQEMGPSQLQCGRLKWGEKTSFGLRFSRRIPSKILFKKWDFHNCNVGRLKGWKN